jgi:hypothetical protein
MRDPTVSFAPSHNISDGPPPWPPINSIVDPSAKTSPVVAIRRVVVGADALSALRFSCSPKLSPMPSSPSFATFCFDQCLPDCFDDLLSVETKMNPISSCSYVPIHFMPATTNLCAVQFETVKCTLFGDRICRELGARDMRLFAFVVQESAEEAGHNDPAFL